MAQIEQSDKGKKKKGAQKKKQIHVDFTPMVDMNMLLITFFMLCTTMIKPQTLNIALPSNEKNPDQTQGTKADEREAMTLILDTERDANGHVVMVTDESGKTYPKHVIYYYQGKALAMYNEKKNGRLAEKLGEFAVEQLDADGDGIVDPEFAAFIQGKVHMEAFRGNTKAEGGGNQYNGIRAILHQRNDSILNKIDELKAKYKENGYSADKEENKRLFEEEAALVRGAKKDTVAGKYDYSYLNPPTLIIKPGPDASFENVISALDEMQINQIGRYQINTIDANDSLLINSYKKYILGK